MMLGCASAPPQCDVSPIQIEELKSDIIGLDKQLVSLQQRLEVAEADLVEWQGKVEARRRAVPELRSELASLKYASGRVEAEARITARKEVDLFKLQEMRDDE